MKKTLAAVLAAAMALSTATVAFATDYESVIDRTPGDVITGDEIRGEMGKSVSYIITNVTDIERINEISGEEIAAAIDDGYITPSVIVTSNRANLDGTPTLTIGGKKTTQTTKEVDHYVWRTYDSNPDNYNLDSTSDLFIAKTWPEDIKKTVREGKRITAFVVNKKSVDNAYDSQPSQNFKTKLEADYVSGQGGMIVYEGDERFEEFVSEMEMQRLNDGSWAGWAEPVYKTSSKTTGVGLWPELSFKFIHTYKTSEISADMRLRFTVKKAIKLGTETYAKGDTITTEIITAKAKYYDMDNLHTDMQLTLAERDARKVILPGADLYDAIGNKAFTITFGDDIAMFEGKAASNQKNVNLWYDLDTIDEIVDAYPTVDFNFIDFKGTPTFQNTGSMTFAAWDENTTVYEYKDNELVPMGGKYDKTYKTITVSGIKKLGTYVIADQILEVEEEPEEPAEPVDSTPVAEPDEDEGGNPNTGAC